MVIVIFYKYKKNLLSFTFENVMPIRAYKSQIIPVMDIPSNSFVSTPIQIKAKSLPCYY